MSMSSIPQVRVSAAKTIQGFIRQQKNKQFEQAKQLKINGNEAFKTNDYTEAIKYYRESIAKLGNSFNHSHCELKSDLHNNLGKAHECINQDDQAEKEFRKAYELRVDMGTVPIKKIIDSTHKLMIHTKDPQEGILLAQDLYAAMREAGIKLNKTHKKVMNPNKVNQHRLKDLYHRLEKVYTNSTGKSLTDNQEKSNFYRFCHDYFSQELHKKFETRPIEGEVTASGAHSIEITKVLISELFTEEESEGIINEYMSIIKSYKPSEQKGVFAAEDIPQGTPLYYVGKLLASESYAPVSRQLSHKMTFTNNTSLVGSEIQSDTGLSGSMVNDALDVPCWAILQLASVDNEPAKNAKLAVIFALTYINQEVKPNMMADESTAPFSLKAYRDIKKGEQLYLEYSARYWLQEMQNNVYGNRGSIKKRQEYRQGIKTTCELPCVKRLTQAEYMRIGFGVAFQSDILSANASFEGPDFDSLCKLVLKDESKLTNKILTQLQDNFFPVCFEMKADFKKALSRELLLELFNPFNVCDQQDIGTYRAKVLDAVSKDVSENDDDMIIKAIINQLDHQRKEADFNGDVDLIRALCEESVIQVGTLNPAQSCEFFSKSRIKAPEFL